MGGLKVWYASGFEPLVEKLDELVEGRRGADSNGWVQQFGQPVQVLVPSSDMGEYLELAVARQAGAAVSYRFEQLQGFLAEHIEEAADGDGGLEVLNRELLRSLLVGVMQEPEELDGELTPVADYILAGQPEEGDGGAERAVDTRRYQLAARLAMVFEEYSFSRADVLEGWEAEPVSYSFCDANGEAADSAAATERWQAALWRRLIEETELCDGILPIPRAFDRVRDRVIEAVGEQVGSGALHVFGFSGFGDEFRRMLVELSEQVDINFYFAGPSGGDFVEAARELDGGWEDVDAGDWHAALRNWGTIGAETLAQLEGDGAAFEVLEGEVRATASAEGLLGSLQEQMLSGTADGAEEPLESAEPSSMTLLECPGYRREVEVVANEIWQRVAEDDTLQFSDVAVAVPQNKAETYLAHIESVFQSFRQLPYTINSMSLEGQSPVLDAAEMIFQLPFGKFTRGELLSLVVHQNLLGRFRDVEQETWVEWVEDLNILYGADQADQEHNGRHYLSDDLFNWDQGLRRLALGSFLDVPEEPAEARLAVNGQDYVPEEVSVSDVDSASALNAVVESLVGDARWLREHRAGLDEWGEVFTKLVDTYLAPARDDTSDFGEDMGVIARVKSTLEGLADLPDIGEVSYRTAYHFAVDRLSAMQTGSGRRFTGGVVVSTPDRLRGLPFEHLFVMGMGEGVFPATDPKSELDLRLQERRLGDVRPSERDRYHFLEMLQSTRRSMTLSWVGREPSTGETLPASSLVADLQRMVPVETTVHPLRRYDRHGDYFPESAMPDDDRPGSKRVSEGLGRNYHPEAFREAQLSAIREQLEANRQVQGAGTGPEIWTGEAFRDAQDRFFEAQEGQEREKKEALLRMIGPGEPEGESAVIPRESIPSEIRISKLVQFLKKPLQAKAKQRLRVYGDDEDAFAEELERLELDALHRAIVSRSMVRKGMVEGADLSEAEEHLARYGDVAKGKFQPGDLPGEVFGEAASEQLAEALAKAGESLQKHFLDIFDLDLDVAPEIFVFSASPEGGELEAPSVELKHDDWEESVVVKLVGETPVRFRARHRSGVGPAFVTLKNSGSVSAKDFLGGYISHIVLSACGGEFEEEPRRVLVFPAKTWKNGPNKTEKYVWRLEPIPADEARRYLSRLLEALFLEDDFELFPIEAVDEVLSGEVDAKTAEVWRYAIDEDSDDWGGIQTQYGPIHNYLDYPPPEEPAATVRERIQFHPGFSPDEEGAQ